MTERRAEAIPSGTQFVATSAVNSADAAVLATEILLGKTTIDGGIERVAEHFLRLGQVDCVATALTTFAPADASGWVNFGQRAWVRQWVRPGSPCSIIPTEEVGPESALTMPWMSERLRFETVTIHDSELLPREADTDRVELASCRVRSVMSAMQNSGDVMFASLSVGREAPGTWPDGYVADLRLLSAALTSRMSAEQAERSLANAIARGDQASLGQQHFFAAIGHELRTPISAILGFADMLKDEASDLADGVDQNRLERFPSAVAKDTGIILRAGEQLLAIVEDLLTTGRTLAGHERESVVVAEAVRDVIHWVRTPARSGRISITSDVPPDLAVTATPAGLRQVLTNVIGNAVVHNVEGGSVTISANRTYGDGGERIRITVRDDGPGLTAEQQQTIFEPFVRFANSTVRGTGLGLSLSRSVAERDGGLLGVDSTPGEGATFWVDLPAG